MKDTFIALLRGVNVGGAHSLLTKDLVHLLESMGLSNVKTCIQSGNAVFQVHPTKTTGLSERIKTRIQRDHGFAPEVILLPLAELKRAIAANPYPGADSDPKALHLTFLASACGHPDWPALDRLRKDSEQYA